MGAHSPQRATRGQAVLDAFAAAANGRSRSSEIERVGQIIYHERRQRVGDIHEDIASLFNGGHNVHAAFPQFLKKAFVVRLGHHRDDSGPGSQSGFDEMSEAG